MDARRGRLAAAVAAALIGATAFAGAAQAATVTSHPPQYVKPSAGPFTWMFAPSVAGAPVSWKLGTETAWHRCTTDTSATFATLPEGRYSFSVADDAPDCSPSDTTAPTTRVTTTRGTSLVVVHGTPPAVPVPIVTATAPSVYKVDAFAATDALSGIASFTWIARDGLAPSAASRRSSITASYPVGVFPGVVTVVDRAANAATQGVTVTTCPCPSRPTSRRPRCREVGSAVLRSHVLPVALTLSERSTVAITARVRAAGHTYRLPVARRALLGNRLVTVRVPVKATVRRAIARALRRHRPVRATVGILAVDQAGNRRSAAGAARITG